MDGTLVDSEMQIFDSLQNSLFLNSLKLLEFDDFRIKFGLPIEKILESHKLKNPQLEKVILDFRKSLNIEINKENRLFDGAFELVDLLASKGVKVGVATSKPTRLAQSVITNSELKNFNIKVVGTDKTPPKPDPWVVNECLTRLQVSKALMVGDRVEDILAGNSAGVFTCGIEQSLHKSNDFRKNGATFVFKHIRQLHDNLEQVFSYMRKTAINIEL